MCLDLALDSEESLTSDAKSYFTDDWSVDALFLSWYDADGT